MIRDKNTERDLELIKSTFENNQNLSYKIFEHMPIGICVTNPTGIFTDVNASYCDIYGYTREELLGNSFTMVVPDETKQELTQLHDDFLDKKFELQGRWKVVDKRGNIFDIISNAAFLYDPTGTEKRKMTLVVKADEMEKTIEQLHTTIEILENKISTQDIANRLAEHDMRNRIGSMISIADILSHTELDDQQAKWVTMLKEIGMDTLKLLRSSKDYAKMERGDFEPNFSRVDLVDLIANQTKELMELITRKNLVISLTDDLNNDLSPFEDNIMVLGDEFYLGHMFQNLIQNALEASPENNLIDISIARGTTVKVYIHNEGMVPLDIQDNFFDKYTSSGKERGTGLGTYMAKLIANVHEGKISFKSTISDGTTLMVELPI